MIKLFEKSTNKEVGSISEDQLQFLIDQLEEEFPSDYDYYFNEGTINLLEENGAEAELLKVLRDAMGGKTDMELRWQRM